MNVYRIHLKTNAKMRQRLIDFCLNQNNQHLAIGWSYLHKSFPDMKTAVELNEAYKRENNGAVKRPLAAFARLQKDDLVWTRDLKGFYYLCRVTGSPYAYCDEELDIGALAPVEAHSVGTSIPGNITSRFTRAGRSPTIERMANDAITIYSMSLYNDIVGKTVYEIPKENKHDLFEFLPPLDLEELVIDYLQIKYDYYLCKNSVAKNDTTIKVECELFPRKKDGNVPAVVQVKGGDASVPPSDFDEYVAAGKHVFLFFSNQRYGKSREGMTYLTREEILEFVQGYFDILPPAIQHWAKME